MLLIREVMHCKPGKVRPLVEKFLAMSRLLEDGGLGKMRVMTDVSAERYWTLVADFEVPSLAAFDEVMRGEGMSPENAQKMDEIMKGYHDLVEDGRREIYRIEG